MNLNFYFPQEYILDNLLPIYILSFFIFPILIVFSIKGLYINKEKSKKDIFSIDTSLALRGIAALVVMIHHYSLRIRQPDKMFYYWFVGYLAVTIFFFLSGYAAIIQLEQKEEKFWDNYFFKRFLRLVLPFIITNTMYALFYRPSISNYIEAMITLKQIRGEYSQWSMVWFLGAILIFTLLFWVSFRFIKKQKIGLIVFLIGTVIYIAINRFVLNSTNYWYNSAMAYVSGIGFGIYRKTIDTYIKRFKKLFLPIFTLITMGIFFATTKGYQDWWIQIICSEIFLCLLITLEYCVQIQSDVLKKLGIASWEIFLIHPLVYSVYYSTFQDHFGFSGVICIFIGIVLGLLINRFDELIISHITKKIIKR